MTDKARLCKVLRVTALVLWSLSQVSFRAATAGSAQARSTDSIRGYLLIGLLALWVLSAISGWIMLLRRGYFADQLAKLSMGLEWLGCVIGIFLLAGLWMVAVLPGPFLIWFARTRKPRPQCPQCKNWLPYGATRCVHCDIEIVSGEKAARTVEPVVQSQEVMEADENKCGNCLAEDTAGQKYFFFYGTFTGSEYLGKDRTRYDFKIAGSQEVYLCNRCVSAYGRKRITRRGLWIGGAMVLMAIIFPLLQQFASKGDDAQKFPFFLVGFMVLLAAGLFFWLLRQHSKAPLAQGDALAIELRSPALRQQGYTRFYTREQMKHNQLM